MVGISAFAQKSNRRYAEKDILAQAQFLEADALFLRGKYPEAVQKLKEFVKEHPEIAMAHFILGRCHEALKETDKSIDELQKAIDLDGHNRWFLIKQAEIYEKNGQADKAAKVMVNLTKVEPQSPFAYKKAAFYFLLAQMPNKAIDILNKGEKRVGFDPEFCQRKHVILLAQGKTQEAIKELQKIIKFYPKESSVRIQLAEIYNSINQPLLAEKQYRKILEYDSFNPAALIGLQKRTVSSGDNDFDGLMKMVGDPNISIDLKIAEIVPSITKASPQSPANQKQQWMAMMDKLMLTHPSSAKATSVSGDMFNAIGEYDKALAAYEKSLEKEKSVFSVWQQTLDLQFFKKQYDKVIKTAESALNFFPNKSRILLYSAEAKFRTGNTKGAIADYQQAGFMSGRNHHQKRFIYGRLAEIYLSVKDYKNAGKFIDKALQMDDKSDPYIKHVEEEVQQKKAIPYQRSWIQRYPFGLFLI